MAIKQFINKAKNKVIDVASDIMSAPAQIKSKMIQDKTNAFAKNHSMVKQMKNVPDSGGATLPNGMPDTLFRARMNDISSMADYEKEYALKRSRANK